MRSLGRGLGQSWQQLICSVANLRRRLLHKRLPEYVVFVLNGALEERTPAQPWWYSFIPGRSAPLSLADLSYALQHIAGDPDVKGVILLCKGASFTLSQAQSLAALFARFRQWDSQYHGQSTKRIIVHLEQIGRPAYIAACAADQIIVTPLTNWDVLGLYAAPTFWKETLALLGVQMDVVKIAPWKTAFDPFSQSSMSDAFAEQTAWLFDSLYADLVEAIHQGRKLPVETVKTLIDGAPWTAEAAKAHGLIDAIAYEDELPALLSVSDRPATLKLYAQVRGLLWRRRQRKHSQAIGVISLTGAIVPGQSRSFPVPLPLFGDDVLGHLTAQQQIRSARQDGGFAAVVVHVDSRGGSALASDLIWRELKLLNQEKPVVVYMGNVAASGGYYIALPSRKIVAQRATLTGSIGVITAKPVLQGAYAKLQANRYIIQRGAHAGLYAEDHPWDAAERQKIEADIRHNYAQFKQRVADDRRLPYDELDVICNGRVWTGAQAQAHGLVDALGDFQVALDLACQAANLPTDGSVPTVDLTPPKQRLLAEPVQAAKAALGISQAEPLQQLARMLLVGEWSDWLSRERYWWVAVDLPKNL